MSADELSGEEKLRRLEQEVLFSKKLLESLPIPVFYEDSQGRYLGCNRAFAEFMSKSENEIIGHTIFDIVDRERAEKHYKRDQKMILKRTSSLAEERQMLHSDGTFHDVLFYKTLIFGESGEVSGLIGAFFDITDRKTAEIRERNYLERLQKLAFALSATQEQERRIIAMEIHDSISQNLALSKIRLKILLETMDSPTVKEELAQVIAAIDDSLQRTREQTFNLGLPVLYQFGLEKAIRFLKEDLLKRHGLFVSFKSTSFPVAINDSFKAFLFRTIQELLRNVVKHAGTDRASVAISQKSDTIFVEVADKGLGFNIEALEEADASNNSYGLFSLKTMIQLMGGIMEISSTPKRGTRVQLRFPIDAFVENNGRREDDPVGKNTDR